LNSAFSTTYKKNALGKQMILAKVNPFDRLSVLPI